MEHVQLLSKTSRILHAVIAFAMIALLAVGIYMEEFEVFALYDIHKAFGAIVLVLAVIRVVWRISKGWPTALGHASKTQLLVAKAIHWILILATVVYPLSGVMMSVGGGHGLSIFGWVVVPENIDAATGEAVAVNEMIAGLGHNLHGTLTYFVIGAILLHVVGALKHHIIDKDGTLTRMSPLK